MAYATVLMSNNVDIKKAPVGFSWTTAIFSGIPALMRGDYLSGVVMIAVGIFFGWLGSTTGHVLIEYGSDIVFAFAYNAWYLKTLVEKGYHVHALPPNLTQDMLHTYCKYVPAETVAA
jgi:hypothetical protein